MDQYQHNLMAGQVLDVDFLSQQMSLDGTGYQVPEGALMISQPNKSESYDMAYMEFFEDSLHYQQQPPPDSRSYSCSSMTSQSRSPPIQTQNAELYGLQMHNLQSSAQPEQTSPTITNDSKKDSDDEGEKTEVRLAAPSVIWQYILMSLTEEESTKSSSPTSLSSEERSQSQAKRA